MRYVGTGGWGFVEPYIDELSIHIHPSPPSIQHKHETRPGAFLFLLCLPAQESAWKVRSTVMLSLSPKGEGSTTRCSLWLVVNVCVYCGGVEWWCGAVEHEMNRPRPELKKFRWTAFPCPWCQKGPPYLVLAVKKASRVSARTRKSTSSHESSDMVAPLEVCTYRVEVGAERRSASVGGEESISSSIVDQHVLTPPVNQSSSPYIPCPRRAAW